MDRTKILSIIIPTYNMEKYLHKCLDSLIVSDETMLQLEVLVVNDGSKDSSSQIAHEYEGKYPQTFRVIDKENGNYGSCINRGLKEATGKYVKVLDADDYFESHCFNSFISFLKYIDVDLVISDYAIVGNMDNVESEFTFDLPVGRTFAIEDIPSGIVEWLWHQGITYRRDIFKMFDYKQTEGISYTDDEWVFKPMAEVKDVVYYPHILYFYLRGRVGQTFDPKVVRRTLEHRIIVAKEMISFYAEHSLSCKSGNISFLTRKLSSRIKSIYSYHLILFESKEGMKRIIEFDHFLKRVSPTLYEASNSETNKYGWHFIRQWRQMGYSIYSPALILGRWKQFFQRLLGHNDVKIEYLPLALRRKS